jgi:hypothetical protein
VRPDKLNEALDALLAAPAGDPRTERAEVEAILTAGYAQALELEAERLQLAEELRRASLASCAKTVSPCVTRLRATVLAMSERIAALRDRLDEANHRHRA